MVSFTPATTPALSTSPAALRHVHEQHGFKNVYRTHWSLQRNNVKPIFISLSTRVDKSPYRGHLYTLSLTKIWKQLLRKLSPWHFVSSCQHLWRFTSVTDMLHLACLDHISHLPALYPAPASWDGELESRMEAVWTSTSTIVNLNFWCSKRSGAR